MPMDKGMQLVQDLANIMMRAEENFEPKQIVLATSMAFTMLAIWHENKGIDQAFYDKVALELDKLRQ